MTTSWTDRGLLTLTTRLIYFATTISPSHSPLIQLRFSSSTSRWKQRQRGDPYARDAKVQGLKSRAAFKLLEMDSKYSLFKKNQTVVDLGFAPGSWSQVAVERTRPHGKVVGIDLIPAQPPKGASTFQGDFLSLSVQKLVKDFLLDQHRRQPIPSPPSTPSPELSGSEDQVALDDEITRRSYIDMERDAASSQAKPKAQDAPESSQRIVDMVLSDMSAPWEQTTGFRLNTLSNPYRRLMNTSGVAFRDHAGSMDLCAAALQFASDTLRPGGHFVCKFYQGSEDKTFELRLKKMFAKVHREKPESSRSESKEAYFVALRRKQDATFKAD